MNDMNATAFETYPVPSYWKPIAFISRARLPRAYDLVFGKNGRYPIEYVAIAKNPFRARRAVRERVRNHMEGLTDHPTWHDSLDDERLLPLLQKDKLRRVLSGIDLMTPSLKNQMFWASMLSTDSYGALNGAGNNDVWRLLVMFTLPLIDELGLEAQRNGINILGLHSLAAPTIGDVETRLFAASGWKVLAVKGETEPRKFFSLLARKIFPVAVNLRPLHALFCGFEPDYWHELVGHCALLIDPDLRDFYQWCGKVALQVESNSASRVCLEDLYKVLLMLLEYGIIKKANGELKAFGGALTSSYMALQRLKLGFIATAPLDPKAMIKNWFADEFPVRRRKGKIELFHVASIAEAKNLINEFIISDI